MVILVFEFKNFKAYVYTVTNTIISNNIIFLYAVTGLRLINHNVQETVIGSSRYPPYDHLYVIRAWLIHTEPAPWLSFNMPAGQHLLCVILVCNPYAGTLLISGCISVARPWEATTQDLILRA